MKRIYTSTAIIIAGIVSVFGFFIFIPVNSSAQEPILFEIPPGQGSRDISYGLEKAGLIRSAPMFRLYVQTIGISNSLQAGEYMFSSSQNAHSIAQAIAQGKVITNPLTVIEGFTLRNIGFLLENKGMFQAEELWEVAGFPAIDYRTATDLPTPKDFSADFAFLQDKPLYVGLEGYLFPDTYHITKHESIEDIIQRMLAHFETKLQSLQDLFEKQERSTFAIVTMASLLEKEVQSLQDKQMVADVLWRRLDIGMALQVDATISYVTGQKITREQLGIDSPFNTYQYSGLPLGPIANPGLESLQAALTPIPNPYWYYLSTPEGTTIFSKTLEEHNTARALYLR